MKPGAVATRTSILLAEASTKANDIEGSTFDPVELVSKYREWAIGQIRMLGSVLDGSGLDQAIRTRVFWAVMTGAVSPQDSMAMKGLVQNELSDRVIYLSTQAEFIKKELGRWVDHGSSKITHALILDTNVLLHHFDEFETMNWNGLLDMRDDSISLAITRQAVRELDNLKKSSNKMYKNGVEKPVRSLARQSLKHIDDWFISPDRPYIFRMRSADMTTSEVTSFLQVIFVLDDIDHIPIPDHDAEIVTRGLNIQPFTASVTVVSYDTAITLQARQAGLKSKLLHEIEPRSGGRVAPGN